MPALFTRMSARPNSSFSSSLSAVVTVGSATSATRLTPRAPALSMALTASFASLRSTATTSTPDSASPMLISRPKPWAAPVTTATRFSDVVMGKSLSFNQGNSGFAADTERPSYGRRDGAARPDRLGRGITARQGGHGDDRCEGRAGRPVAPGGEGAGAVACGVEPGNRFARPGQYLADRVGARAAFGVEGGRREQRGVVGAVVEDRPHGLVLVVAGPAAHVEVQLDRSFTSVEVLVDPVFGEHVVALDRIGQVGLKCGVEIPAADALGIDGKAGA